MQLALMHAVVPSVRVGQATATATVAAQVIQPATGFHTSASYG